MACSRRIFVRHPLAIATTMTLAGLAGIAQAEEIYDLGEVVVTASRTAQTVEGALAPVTVVTRRDIENSQASNVIELLNRTPGLQATNNGGAGSHSSIYLRGTTSAQTLVLLDGQKINSANTGTSPLHYLDPEQIERIEIVRGPRSSLYGADAIGGVVQIFTRQGKGDPKLSVKVGGGSRNTGEYSLNFSGKTEGIKYNLGTSFYETGGYDNTLMVEDGDMDDDAYRNKSVFANLSRKFSNDVEAGVSFSHSEGKVEYDNNDVNDYIPDPYTTQPYNVFRLTNISSYIAKTLSDNWDTRIQAGYTEELSRGNTIDRSTGQSADSYYSETESYSASWQNDISWSEQQLLTAGIDYSKEKYQGSTDYDENSRYNAGVFIQNISTFDRSDLQLGLRQDKNEAYGYNTTGNASLGFTLPADLRLIASLGTAFRAPTMGDLYYPGFSNPDLKPETAETAELELRGKFSKGHWGVSIYQNNMEDMIAATFETGYIPDNIAKARIRGVELNATAKLWSWDIATSLSFLEPEDRSAKNRGKTLRYRSKQLFSLDVNRQYQRFSIGGSFNARGSSFADGANTKEVAGFGVVDLRASMKVTPELKASVKLVNLFDKEYQAVDGYRGEPFGGFLTLVWTPEI